nr:oxidoreductase vrti [Quercus suber]
MAASDSVIVSKSLTTVSLDGLRAGNETENKKLLGACRTQGFFYLDLSSDVELCAAWEAMLARSKDYFEQPLDVKMQDARSSDNYGYLPVGTEPGSKPKTRDGYETLKVHTITLLLLDRLSTELGLTGPSRFECDHEDNQPSLSTLVLLHYPKHNEATAPTNVGHIKHTDASSLSFLLTKQWGLQIMSPETKRWEFIEPRPKHAIVNVGDYLHFLSGGQLLSVVHRVLPLEEKQHEDRYSIGYFMRQNDDAKFTDLSGKTWTTKEWHDLKYNVFKKPDTFDTEGQFLTGMMEQKIAA